MPSARQSQIFHKNSCRTSTVCSITLIRTTNISFRCLGYARTLHRSLNFSLTDMRKALGTSIRTASSELRKVANHRLVVDNILEDTNDDEEKEVECQLHDDSVDSAEVETGSDTQAEGQDEDSDVNEADEAEDDDVDDDVDADEDDDENNGRCAFIDDEVEESDNE